MSSKATKLGMSMMPEATLVQFSTPQLVTADVMDFKPSKDSRGFLTNDDKTGLKKKSVTKGKSNTHTIQCPAGTKPIVGDQDILNMISPPRVWTEKMKQWRQMVSSVPATRTDVVELKKRTEAMLKLKNAHKTGLCLIRRSIYSQVFDEIIRHITVNCAERGLILIHVRDDLRYLMAHFERIYSSAIAYGIRKTLQALHEQDRLMDKIKHVQHEVDQEKRIYDEMLPHYKRFAEQYLKTSEELEKEFHEEHDRLQKRKNQLKRINKMTEASLDGGGVRPVEGMETMTLWEHVKSNGPKLAFFFKAVAVYFVFFIPSDKPSVFGMLLKCLPILALVLFVLLHGISTQNRHSFSRKIVMGLLFSCLGDAFLIWPSHFPHGMAAFGIAQIFYTWAYGFKHTHLSLGAGIYIFNTVGMAVILPNMMNAPVPVIIGLPVYSFLLTTMVWRAIGRLESLGEWNWTKMCSTVGAIVFAVSDGLIGISLFVYPIPYSQALIMSTYYIAQFCIALSIINTDCEVGVSMGQKKVETTKPTVAAGREELFTSMTRSSSKLKSQ